jgi:two-component system, NtrC family, nitrogen regulation response regulator NtrX
MKPHLLVVDDEPDIRELLQEILEDEGFEVETAADGQSARAARRARRPDLVLLDIWMPDVDGISLLKEWHEQADELGPVIMMSGHGTVETAVEATRLGAYDFIEKPLSIAKLMLTVRNALSSANLARENQGLRRELDVSGEPLGKSAVMVQLREQARRAAGHDAAVLITGESGSGKAALARFIHQQSSRKQGPFVRISVAALAHAGGVAELFGSENGDQIRYGALESANGGFAFLEDIADLDAAMQARLAGVLQHKRFQRVGANTDVMLDARLIVASARALPELVQAGEFRADLYYMLDVVPLHTPPLREHTEDLPELVEHFVEQLVGLDNLPYRRFPVAAQNRLRHHRWPGNTRELANLVQRLLILGDSSDVTADEVDAALGAAAQPQAQTKAGATTPSSSFDLPLKEAREEFERAYFAYHLRETGGSVSKVAQAAGLERTHLYRKLRSIGINVKDL